MESRVTVEETEIIQADEDLGLRPIGNIKRQLDTLDQRVERKNEKEHHKRRDKKIGRIAVLQAEEQGSQ